MEFQAGGRPAELVIWRSFPRVLQRTPQLVAGAVDVGLDGPQGEVQGAGNLLVGPSLDVPEQDAGSVLGAQEGDGALDGGAELFRLHLVQRVLRAVGDVEPGGFYGVGGGRMGRAIHAHGVELTAAEMIDRDVVGDLEQPGGELEVRSVAIEMGEDFDEGVLGQILGELTVAHHAEDEREDRPLVSLDQLAMRGVAALECEGDDVGIGQVGKIEGAEHGGVKAAVRGPMTIRPRPRESYASPQAQSSGATTQCGIDALALPVRRNELSPMTHTETPAQEAAAGGADKRAYVRAVFEQIAPRYDLLNHLLSLNIDRYWRRRALRMLEWRRAPAGVYLDLCAGTLDVGAELSREREFRGFIVAADFAIPMLRAGAGKASRSVLAPVGADAQQLPLADGSVDGAAVAFGIRNVASLDAALSEAHRVLTPGARFVILEFTTPPSRVVRGLYHLYFHRLLPWIGGMISGHRSAYAYLPESVANFPGEPELARRMTNAGFTEVRWERLTLGIAAIHVGVKA
jgi:demethylmenaquinone methyltransferase / 2-methoxy-6-polyprenyl-1,4-benzoquinol methylase